MYDPDDLPLKQSLRDGLRSLPVPAVAFDFDDQVLAALRAPQPWPRRLWALVWEPARPLLLGASCSLLVTLLLLHWTLSVPVAASTPSFSGTSAQAPSAAPARALSLDALLDRPGLRAGSLAALAAPLPTGRRPAPRRRVQTSRQSDLTV